MNASVASPPAGKAKTKLWSEMDIPIIIGTGEFGQGKSIFGLTICPGPETLAYDHECGLRTYRSLGFTHVDMGEELMAKYPNGFTPEQRYTWWREDVVTRGRTGKYRVCVCDPVSEIEDGLADYVKKNPQKYGATAAQFERSPALFWGAMKREWKAFLDRIRTSFETVYLVVHMRDEFRGSAPTGKREPKGKETLMELASLFLEFERDKDKQGNVAAIPSAKVLKSRLTKFIIGSDGEMTMVPVLPPRIPKATPAAIRNYIATPPDYDHLSAAERDKEKQMSDDDKLRLQAQISANNATAAQAEVSRLEKMQQAAAAQAASRSAPSPDKSADYGDSVRDKAESSASEPSDSDSASSTISDELIGKIKVLCGEAFEPGGHKAFLATWLKDREVAKVTELTQSQGEELEIDLLKLKSARTQAAAAEKLANGGTHGDSANVSRGSQTKEPESDASEPSGEGSAIAASVAASSAGSAEHVDEEELGTVTKEQLLRIKSLAERTNWGRDAQERWLNAHGLANFRSLSKRMADDRINDLISVELGFSGDPPGN